MKVFLNYFLIFFSFTFFFPQSEKIISISLDHVNVAVNDLKKAEEFFKSIGFTVKPGRFHQNSIENIHLKFWDGTEIEFITAKQPLDKLAEKYIKFKSEGDGGAFLALRTSTYEKVNEKLTESKILYEKVKYEKLNSIDFPDESPFSSLWMPEIIVPWIDKPEILNHRNGAIGLESVWFDSSLSKDFIKLFSLLGFEINENQIKLTNGNLMFVNKKVPVNNRPIRGASIKVDDIKKIEKYLNSAAIPYQKNEGKILLFPENTFGIWLEFIE